MTRPTAPPVFGGNGINRDKLKKVLNHLAVLEEQMAQQTRAAFLSHLNAQGFIYEKAFSLATDLSLAACTTGSAFNPMIFRSVAKGLYLGLRDAGLDFYESAYLTMLSILNGATLGNADVYQIALAGSKGILGLAEQLGADKEIVIRKMAAGALEAYLPCDSEEAAIEQLFLELFELVAH